MTIGIVETAVVKIDHAKAYKAFTDPSLSLYLPVSEQGEIVSVEKASKIEHWTVSDQVQDEVPHTLANSTGAISNALIKTSGDHSFAILPRSVAFGGIGALQTWLKTLVRNPSGDLLNFQLYQEGV